MAELQEYVAALAERLGVEPAEVDVRAVLDLARRGAHRRAAGRAGDDVPRGARRRARGRVGRGRRRGERAGR